VSGNHFYGISIGPTLIAGYLREDIAEDGIRYVYPYLDEYYNPKAGYCHEDYEVVMKGMRATGKKVLLLTLYAGGEGSYINHADYIVDAVYGLGALADEYNKYGDFQRVSNNEQTEESAVEDFKDWYQCAPEELKNPEYVKGTYMNFMREYGYTEDEFEEFFIQQFGQEEWNAMGERDTNGED
jgi:hypothetical protein